MSTTEQGPALLSSMHLRKTDGMVLNLSGQGLNKLDPNALTCADIHTLILDNNNIIKLENLDKGTEIKQLSVACNRLVRMMGVSKLRDLRVLNLPNNSIGYVEGLKDLAHLEWLNLAGNNLKVMDELNSCVGLQCLDLSDNNISVIGDISKLTKLKALHLHANTITTLRSVPAYLPSSLTVLSLAENEIRDLNEVSYLATLHSLEQLSIMSNPCVMATPSLPGCDYRPYVVSWCLNLKMLDGYSVSQKEGLKAEWMYSQGKGHGFRPGQHEQLVQYLSSVCPLTVTPASQSAEDAKLERILNKQRQHQKQLLKSSNKGWSGLACPTPFNMEQQSYELSEGISAPPPVLIHRTEPVLKINSWMDNGPSVTPVLCSDLSPTLDSDSLSLKLEDVQTDEEKLHGTQLSSESFFLPVASSTCPPMPSDDSDNDIEPYSVPCKAPSHSYAVPVQAKTTTSTHSPSLMSQEQHSEVEGSFCLQTYTRNYLRVNGEQCKLGNGEPASAKDVRRMLSPLDGAAVRIQAWWRGHRTRLSHPQAKEVRAEMRLRRMQEHIVYLSSELRRVHKQLDEERLQRLVQEEAVKCLWKQLQSVITWQNTVMEQLKCGSSAALACSQSNASMPESELHSNGYHQGISQDSINSRATTDSAETVLSMGAATAQSQGVESSEGNLREQQFSSVHKQQEEKLKKETCA